MRSLVEATAARKAGSPDACGIGCEGVCLTVAAG